MKRVAQGGILLLPVALVLAITGALAYTMTRSGSMNVSAVDAQYDTDVARYLAEAGLNLAKWQNQKLGCGNSKGFDTVTLPGGSVTASSSDISADSEGRLSVAVDAATPSGAAQRLERSKIIMHSLNGISEVTLGGSSAIDTFIRDGSGAQKDAAYLEMTDGKAHGLIKFWPSALPHDALVARAELKLYQYDTKSTQLARTLAVHRVVRDWPDSATWTSPWSGAPGGDYAAEAAATVDIKGNGEYVWRIDALVEGWANDSLNAYGLLLKPSGLLEARFASFESAANRPRLVVRFYPRCT